MMNAEVIDILFESALVLSAICFSLSLYVLAKGTTNKLNISYSILTLNISLWALSFFVAEVLQLRLFETVHLITTLLLTPFAFAFAQMLLRPEGKVFQIARPIIYAITIFLIPLVTLGLDRYPWIRDMSYYSPVVIILILFYLFCSEAFGMVQPRGGTNAPLPGNKSFFRALHKRNNLLYLGGIFVCLICVWDRVPWLGRTVPAIGNIFLAVYCYFLKDIVMQQQFLNYRRLLGRMLSGFVCALVFGSVFVLITVWVKDSPILYAINVLFAALVAVAIYEPTRSLVAFLFQRFFFKESSRIAKISKDASKEIAGAFSEDVIVNATKKLLEGALAMPIRSAYILDTDGKDYKKVYDETNQELPNKLSGAYPLVQHWLKASDWKPILSEEMEALLDRAALSKHTETYNLIWDSLKKLESTLALPWTHEDKVLGFVTLNVEDPPELWGSNWGILALLRPYFCEAGEALHELDIYARMRERDRLILMGEMAAGLAHEIRNPLGAIKGAAQVIDLDEHDPMQPLKAVIVEEVDRLNKVVTQFLDYAKPFRPEFQFVDLNKMMFDASGRIRRKFKSEENSIDIDVIPDRDAPLAYCNSGLIDQVMTNLIENAQQALNSVKDGKICLRLGHELEGEQTKFALTVEDNGPGIPKENLDKIFIPFFTSFRNGTGLGLPICQRIAEAHGGRVEVLSHLEEGTRLTLKFPSRRVGGEMEQQIH